MRLPFVTLAICLLILFEGNSAWSDEPSFDSAFYEPWDYSDDFETNEVNGWDSYPPWEDTAFDFTLLCMRSVSDGGTLSLTRELKPNYRNQLLPGLIKKFNFVLDGNSYIRFSYYMDWYENCDQLKLVLCGSDGKLYEYDLNLRRKGMVRTWHNIQIPLAKCMSNDESAQNGLEIQAIYILPVIESADPDLMYRFHVDDFYISALRLKEFDIIEPETVIHEQWNRNIALRHFYSGGKLTLKVQVPDLPSPLELVTCSLINLQEDFKKENISSEPLSDGEKQSRIWRFSQVLDDEFPPGNYQAIITGILPDGGRIQSEFSFFIVNKKSPEHPRILFGGEEREKLKKRINESGAGEIWREISARAKRMREEIDLPKIGIDEVGKFDSTYWLPTYGEYASLIREASEMIELNALVYSITGEAEALSAARKNLIRMCAWKEWCHPWVLKRGQHTYWPVGLTAASLATAYDLIYENLTVEERQCVRDALMEKHVIPTFREYYLANRVPFHTSNWIPHTVASALIVIGAIYGDDPALRDLEPYLSGFLLKLNEHIRWTFDRDGAYGEGWGYQYFDCLSLFHVFPVLEKMFFVDLLKQSPVARSYLHPLYSYIPPGTLLDYGDTENSIHGLSNFAWLAGKTRDPRLNWFYRQFNNRSVQDFIYFDRNIPEHPPEKAPNSRFFRDRGILVSRTGWGPESAVFIEKGGPFYNHNHFDQGGFFLNVAGETLLGEAGRAGYYDDPWYWQYFIQAAGHSTVLVDDDPESQRAGDLPSGISALRNSARTESYLCSDFYDFARQELSGVYRGKLSKFTRTVLFSKPNYILFFDRIRSSSENTGLTWQVHTHALQETRVGPDAVRVNGSKGYVDIRMLTPDNVIPGLEQGKIQISAVRDVLARGLNPPGILKYKLKEQGRDAIVAVLIEPYVKNDLVNPAPAIVVRGGDNASCGFEIKKYSGRDVIVFQNDLCPDNISFMDVAAHGAHAFVSELEGQIVSWAVDSGVKLLKGNGLLWASDVPVNASAQYEDHGIRTTMNVEKNTRVTIYTGRKPKSVWREEEKRADYEFHFNPANKTTTIVLEPGIHRLQIEL